MKTQEAKPFWVGFQAFFISLKDLKKKKKTKPKNVTHNDKTKMGTSKSGKKIDGAVSENIVLMVTSLHSP